MITLRPISRDETGRVSREEYATLEPWWTLRDAYAPPREMLPGMGVVAEHGGQPAACGFIYLDATGSGVAALSWLATRPGLGRMTAYRCLRHVVECLTIDARRMDYWLVTAGFHTRGILGLLESAGFQAVRGEMTTLLKPLI